ncbi:MAG TPA: YgiQ family radical SAM protein [Pirellulales bacterium]
MTRREMEARGWDAVDIVFVTGDAYVDHPSFAMALLGRLLEDEGFRVAILSQPDWHSCEAWRTFGQPRLFFAISAGNMDSMINHYTANRKVRNDDAYSPGGKIGRRPDRATLAYCQRAREAFKGVPIIAGGVEASLRRLAHYDYWSDKVRRSIVLDAKCDLLVYGMGERPIIEIAHQLAAGASVKDLRNLRGVAYRLGAKETSELQTSPAHLLTSSPAHSPLPIPHSPFAPPTITLPSFESVSGEDSASKKNFCTLTKISHQETNPHNAKRLVQYHGAEAVVVNPGALPLAQPEMDRVYGLPFTRQPHPSYGKQKIPAYDVVKHSVQIMRGCFGGCTFCSITAHEGRIIQSRSQESVLAEIERMKKLQPDFTGVVSDIGGPTANMYEMKCTRPEVEAKCRRLSCVHPTICKLLGTDHTPLVELMQKSRELPGVKKVLIASGIRMDLARRDPKYMRELAQHHVGGHLKVAPEHTDPGVLDLMKKPSNDDFEKFGREFQKQSKAAGKKQYLIPYYIASHPGSDLNAMIELAQFLKQNHYQPDQVQDFIPSPFDIAACMYHTGYNPFTMRPVYIAKHLRDRRLQRALLQFFKPENYFEVRQALEKTGRQDLIGNGCDCLIPERPPKEALSRRRRKANESLREQEGDHIRSGKPRRPATNSSTSNRPLAPGSTGGRSAKNYRKGKRQYENTDRAEEQNKGVGYRPHRSAQNRKRGK